MLTRVSLSSALITALRVQEQAGGDLTLKRLEAPGCLKVRCNGGWVRGASTWRQGVWGGGVDCGAIRAWIKDRRAENGICSVKK